MTEEITELMEILRSPFDIRNIKWRVGSTDQARKRGLALAYIDARDVMGRLDQVCGIDGWQDEYAEVLGRIICRLSIRMPRTPADPPGLQPTGEWITKCDGSGDTAIEAEKGGISRAFCRAASRWGIGRYLYYLPSTWCELDERGRIKNPPQLPTWAIPKGVVRALHEIPHR
jgi:hypothetical protein